MMCRPLGLAPSGYYTFIEKPASYRALAYKRILGLIRMPFNESQGGYGVPRVLLAKRKAGQTCSKYRVARLMRAKNIGKGRLGIPWHVAGGKPAALIANLVKRNIDVSQPRRI